jgi:hypothetical protein
VHEAPHFHLSGITEEIPSDAGPIEGSSRKTVDDSLVAMSRDRCNFLYQKGKDKSRIDIVRWFRPFASCALLMLVTPKAQ